MTPLSQHPEVIDDITVQLTRQKSPAELTLLTSNMFANAREMIRGYLREQHPDWTEKQIYDELFLRIHGTDPITAVTRRRPQ